MARTDPYSAFNFLIKLGDEGPDPEQSIGGFSEIDGLGVELKMAEYRNGNEPENHVRKYSGLHSIPDVTCTRGLIQSDHLYTWIKQTMSQGYVARRNIVIELRDETGVSKQAWTLRNAVPMKWVGPTLNAKSSDQVALEKLTFSAEGIDFELLS